MQWCEDTCRNGSGCNKLYQGRLNSTYSNSTNTTNGKSTNATYTNSEGTGNNKTTNITTSNYTSGNSKQSNITYTFSNEVYDLTNTTCITYNDTTRYCSEKPNTTITNTTVRLEYVVKNGQKISCENYDYNYIPEKTD